jgi:hypothetical protein
MYDMIAIPAVNLYIRYMDIRINEWPGKGKSSPVKGLGWPRGFQEVKVPRFHDNCTGW